MSNRSAVDWVPPNPSNERLLNLCGPLDQNLRQIELLCDVRIKRRAERFELTGTRETNTKALNILMHLEGLSALPVSAESLQLIAIDLASKVAVKVVPATPPMSIPTASDPKSDNPSDQSIVLMTKKSDLQGRTANQRRYMQAIQTHDITFGIGPAGTGKTYLAVASAVDALERDLVKRIVLTRPAVEAGERLGFLPGDLNQKVDPYLRPLYDALYELLGFEKTSKLFERQTIEVAPLAYMRGRTLNHCFIILDEAQNTTPEQMKMFLTRIGFGSKAVVTGDVTQIDLPRTQQSGLVQARQVLKEVGAIAQIHFDGSDIVRHPLIAKIVDAYERHQQRNEH
jgi:phosphate starvation-inducible protein PhoH and related proteins